MSYARGKALRSTKITDLILDKLAVGSSVTGAVGSSISEKFKARSLGVKEKFDPLSIVRFMTGGSKLATGVAGRIMGRSQSDIDYFTGRRPSFRRASRISAASVTPTENISGSTQALSKIYNFLKKSREEKRKEYEIMRDFENSKINEEERRHTEVINVFLEAMGKTKRKQKDLASLKLDFNDAFKKQEKDSSKKLDSTSILSKLKPLLVFGGLTVLGTEVLGKMREEREPTAENVPIKQEGGTATKIPSEVPQERTQKVESSSVLSRIRAREGGGKTPYEMVNIVGKDVKSATVQKGNVDVTTGQPYERGLTEMTMGDVHDLQLRRSKFYGQAGAGSAAGAYGFMPGTLAQVASERFGPTRWRSVPFTQEVQDLLAEDLLKRIKNNIIKAGLPVSEAMMYTMWFFGTENPQLAYRLVYSESPLRMLDENMVGSNALKANPQLKGKSIGWYRDEVLKNKNKGELSTVPLEGTVSGDNIDRTSKENVDAKQSLAKKANKSIMFNRIVQPKVENSFTTQTVPTPENHPVLNLSTPDIIWFGNR